MLLENLVHKLDHVRKTTNLCGLSTSVRSEIEELRTFNGLSNTFLYSNEAGRSSNRLQEEGKTHGGKSIQIRLLLTVEVVSELFKKADMQKFIETTQISTNLRVWNMRNPTVYKVTKEGLYPKGLGEYVDENGFVRFATFELALDFDTSFSRYMLQPTSWKKIEAAAGGYVAREYVDKWRKLIIEEKGRQFVIDDPMRWPARLPWMPTSRHEMPMIVWVSCKKSK